jgi:hypothetical protein
MGMDKDNGMVSDYLTNEPDWAEIEYQNAYEELVRNYQEGNLSERGRKQARRLFHAVEMKIRRRVKKLGIKAKRLNTRQTKGFFWTFTYPVPGPAKGPHTLIKTITLRDIDAVRWFDEDMEGVRWLDAYLDYLLDD